MSGNPNEAGNGNAAPNEAAEAWNMNDAPARAGQQAPAESAETSGAAETAEAAEAAEAASEPGETPDSTSGENADSGSAGGQDGGKLTIHRVPPLKERLEQIRQQKYEEGLSGRRLEAYKQRDEREQTTAEKRLETHEKRLKEIEKQLEEAEGDKASLEEILGITEGLLEENSKQHESLSSKADNLEREIKQCKRKVLSKISRFAKATFKAVTAGEFWRINAAALDIDMDASKGDEAQQALKETREEIDANESEGTELRESLDDTIDQIDIVNKKSARLTSEKAQLEREVEELKAMVHDDAFQDAIIDYRGGKSVRRSMRALAREERNEEARYADRESALQKAYKQIEEDIQQNDASLGAASLIGRVRGAQGRADAERAGKHQEVLHDIDIRRSMLLSETESFKGSLSRLKTKIMDKLRLARMR